MGTAGSSSSLGLTPRLDHTCPNSCRREIPLSFLESKRNTTSTASTRRSVSSLKNLMHPV